MESLEEFRKRVKKCYGPKELEITNCITLRTIYRWNRKNKVTSLDESAYSRIIKAVNKKLVTKLGTLGSVKFPQHMGGLYIEERDTSPYYNKSGRLIIPKRIDWNRTLKFWYENPEYHKEKRLLYKESPISYRVKYTTGLAKFKNKQFYHFHLSRNASKIIQSLVDNNTLTYKRR